MSETVTPVRVGQVVPNFNFTYYDPTTNGFGTSSLEDLKKAGKWSIFFFYPADFTFVCATEFAALAEQQDEFAKLGAEILTVSSDTQYVHLAWRREEKALESVKYKMVADPSGKIGRIFGCLEEAAGLSLRGTYIVSPEGKLMNADVNFFNMGRNIDEIMRKFKANTYLSTHPAETCPAKWKSEGDKTLTPGPGLVGKVGEALKR
ncbi:MAG TPA: redoxin domain-containing protein [Planctomycetota bacterium]|jgi:peroxiredoxin (alkyl hydroperoxide reductase subunit C)|nr:redoxin domain-containing protein [Planctomycetota bacterium]